jgi:hypothetical protein
MDAEKSMKRLVDEILTSDMKKYVVTIKEENSDTCKELRFAQTMPLHYSERIKRDIENGLYPGLLVKPVFQRHNLYDLKVCKGRCK